MAAPGGLEELGAVQNSNRRTEGADACNDVMLQGHVMHRCQNGIQIKKNSPSHSTSKVHDPLFGSGSRVIVFHVFL